MALEIKMEKASRRPAGGYPISHPTLPDHPLNPVNARTQATMRPTEGRTGRMATAGRRGRDARPREVSSYPVGRGRTIIATTGGLFQKP